MSCRDSDTTLGRPRQFRQGARRVLQAAYGGKDEHTCRVETRVRRGRVQTRTHTLTQMRAVFISHAHGMPAEASYQRHVSCSSLGEMRCGGQ